MLSAITVKKGTLTKLRLNASSRMRFSDNVVNLNVLSTLEENNINRAYVTDFNCGSNVSALDSYCFKDCANLTSVTIAKDRLVSIGNYAFSGCTNLSKMNILDEGRSILIIGDYAFSNTAISNAKLNIVMKNASIVTSVGDHVFVNCANLKHVEFMNGNYIEPYMFYNCNLLDEVVFAGTTYSFGNNAFLNCTSLKNISLPSDIPCLPDNTFDGCTSLANVLFLTPGNLYATESIGNRVFNGTAITSLVLPESIDSLDSLSPYSLEGMGQLKELHFNGINAELLWTVEQNSLTSTNSPKYPMNTIYATTKLFNHINATKALTSNAKKIFTRKDDNTSIIAIINYAIDNHIPVIAFYTNETNTGCGRCKDLISNVINNDNFINMVKTNYNYYFVYGGDSLLVNSIICKNLSLMRLTTNKITTNWYGLMLVYWQKSNNTAKRGYTNSADWAPSDYENIFLKKVKSVTKGYVSKYLPNELQDVQLSELQNTLQLQDTLPASVSLKYELNHLYMWELNFIHESDIMNSTVKSICLTFPNPNDIVNLMVYAKELHIPIVYIHIQMGWWQGDNNKGEYSNPKYRAVHCDRCKNMIENVFNTNNIVDTTTNKSFVDMIRTNNKYYYILGGSLIADNSTFRIRYPTKSTYYIKVYFYWNSKDNSIIHTSDSGMYGTVPVVRDRIVGKAHTLFKDYVAPTIVVPDKPDDTPTTAKINLTIVNTNCFGLNHDVTIFSSDNKKMTYKNLTGGAGQIIFTGQTVYVDRITTNDFKYKQWYYNAVNMKPYADANEIPVLAIATQGNSYFDSKSFNDNIFDDDSFLTAVMSKNILLCKVDSSSFSNNNASFLVNTWMKDCDIKKLPLIMAYRYLKNGATIITTGATVPDILTSFAYFSINSSDTKVGNCDCIHNVDELVEWVNSQSMFNSYSPQSIFMKPIISEYLGSYPKYKRYDNLPDDDYGRYYPVASLDPFDTVNSYEVDIGSVKYTIKMNNSSIGIPPNGTYLYYTLLSTAENASIYSMIYDLSGIIFKVGNPQGEALAFESLYSYLEYEVNSYLASFDITNYVSAARFNYDLYLEDNNEDPTTSLDPKIVARMPFLWNQFVNMTNIIGGAYDGLTIVNMKLWLSSNVLLVEDDDDDEDDEKIKRLVPLGSQYVVSSLIYCDLNAASLILWIRQFHNDV